MPQSLVLKINLIAPIKTKQNHIIPYKNKHLTIPYPETKNIINKRHSSIMPQEHGTQRERDKKRNRHRQMSGRTRVYPFSE